MAGWSLSIGLIIAGIGMWALAASLVETRLNPPPVTMYSAYSGQRTANVTASVLTAMVAMLVILLIAALTTSG